MMIEATDGLMRRARVLTIIGGLLALVAQGGTCAPATETKSLAGVWRFALDPTGVGEKEQWFARELAGTIKLPGALQAQGYGKAPSSATEWTAAVGVRNIDWRHDPKFAPYLKADNFKMPFVLTPERHYVGAAWYQRQVKIPPGWASRRVVLMLER